MAATAMPIPLVTILGILKFRRWYIGDSRASSDIKVPSSQLDGLTANGNGDISNGKEPKLLSISDKSDNVESFIKPSASNGSYVALCKDDPDAEAGNGVAKRY